MGQPISGDQYTVIGTVGTTVIRNSPTVLKSIIIPGTYVGTVNFHDAAAAAGTSATSSVLIVGLPNTSIPFQIDPFLQLKKGLVTEATGTPTMTITWGD